MQTPTRAPVRPHGVSALTGARLLLEDEVLALAGETGAVALLGPSGAGRTTALRHLAAILPPGTATFLDEPTARAVTVAALKGLVVYADQVVQGCPPLAAYRLAPWAEDELIEYLLERHRPQCRAVMARVTRPDYLLLEGIPELWRAALDQLAADAALPDVRSALAAHLATLLPDTDLVERARSLCLNALSGEPTAWLPGHGFPAELSSFLRHRAARRLLAAERMAADLAGDAACDWLAARLPRDLVKTAAALIGTAERPVEHLRRLLEGPDWSHAMAASLLHATAGWRPPSGQPGLLLRGAYLDGAVWPGVALPQANLEATDLSTADLTQADLAGAHARGADFHGTTLRTAVLVSLDATEADFRGANLSGARADSAHLDGTCLAGAILNHADFSCARLYGADLTEASFREARLASTALTGAVIQDTDFRGASFQHALLMGLDLRHSLLDGASFELAILEECNLEEVRLPGANFRQARLKKALLTGSVMPGAIFSGADLRETGLAEVEWEGVDLSNANLSGASFHLGSTRSGLVGSTIASEGSRTGFYTDDFDEQTFRSPEEIRKANLCGADLRGATLENVDFYLVDLRGASYSREQEAHFRHCGAILGDRS